MRWLLKRWCFWGGAGFMLVAVCVGYLLIPVGEGRISQASCDRIQLGWTVEEVKRLLGEHVIHAPDDIDLGTHWFEWYDDGNGIRVTFSAQGTAIKKDFQPSSLSIYEYMKRRIERRVRAFWP
jgi:hypothetical protein